MDTTCSEERQFHGNATQWGKMRNLSEQIEQLFLTLPFEAILWLLIGNTTSHETLVTFVVLKS